MFDKKEFVENVIERGLNRDEIIMEARDRAIELNLVPTVFRALQRTGRQGAVSEARFVAEDMEV